LRSPPVNADPASFWGMLHPHARMDEQAGEWSSFREASTSGV
jgi:hypothetical protein